MPVNTGQFLTDLRATLAAALPEVSEISEVEHLNKVSWADLALPYVAVLLSRFQEWADQPADTNIFECQCQIWYVLEVPGASSGIRAKLEAIIDLFYPNDPTPLGDGQVLNVMGYDYSDELGPNMLLAAAGHTARAGMVELRCLVGEGP